MSETPVYTKMDRYKSESLKAFNTKWPDFYDSSAWVRFWVRRYDEEILSVLPIERSSLRVLDIGCATGRLLVTLAKAGIKELAGVDLAPKMVHVAKQRLSEIGIEADLKVADVEDKLSWTDESFDVITLTGVFHHFFRAASALAEIHRLLICGGVLLIIDPWFPSLLRQLINFYLRFMSHDGDCHFYSPSQLAKLLTTHGFCEIQYRRAALHSYIVSGRKMSHSEQSKESSLRHATHCEKSESY